MSTDNTTPNPTPEPEPQPAAEATTTPDSPTAPVPDATTDTPTAPAEATTTTAPPARPAPAAAPAGSSRSAWREAAVPLIAAGAALIAGFIGGIAVTHLPVWPGQDRPAIVQQGGAPSTPYGHQGRR